MMKRYYRPCKEFDDFGKVDRRRKKMEREL